MFSALLSFLGGSVFRMIWGEVSHWLTEKQQHAFELERLRLNNDMEAAQHARNLEALKVQSDLGIKTIQVQSQADMDKIGMEGWLEAVKATAVVTGVRWIDAWNATIRPAVATWAIGIVTLGEFKVIILSEAALSIASAALGIYLAERNLLKRGK